MGCSFATLNDLGLVISWLLLLGNLGVDSVSCFLISNDKPLPALLSAVCPISCLLYRLSPQPALRSMSSSGPASASRLETLCSWGADEISFLQLDLCEACFDVRLTNEELAVNGKSFSDECEALRCATRFSFPIRRRVDELDPKERAEPEDGL